MEEILYRKKEIIIILITKQESIELQKFGHKFGSDGNLHKSKSREIIQEGGIAFGKEEKVKRRWYFVRWE